MSASTRSKKSEINLRCNTNKSNHTKAQGEAGPGLGRGPGLQLCRPQAHPLDGRSHRWGSAAVRAGLQGGSQQRLPKFRGAPGLHSRRPWFSGHSKSEKAKPSCRQCSPGTRGCCPMPRITMATAPWPSQAKPTNSAPSGGAAPWSTQSSRMAPCRATSRSPRS